MLENAKKKFFLMLHPFINFPGLLTFSWEENSHTLGLVLIFLFFLLFAFINFEDERFISSHRCQFNWLLFKHVIGNIQSKEE